MQCKPNLFQRPGHLNDAQLPEIKDILEHCIPLDVPYLTSS